MWTWPCAWTFQFPNLRASIPPSELLDFLPSREILLPTICEFPTSIEINWSLLIKVILSLKDMKSSSPTLMFWKVCTMCIICCFASMAVWRAFRGTYSSFKDCNPSRCPAGGNLSTVKGKGSFMLCITQSTQQQSTPKASYHLGPSWIHKLGFPGAKAPLRRT